VVTVPFRPAETVILVVVFLERKEIVRLGLIEGDAQIGVRVRVGQRLQTLPLAWLVVIGIWVIAVGVLSIRERVPAAQCFFLHLPWPLHFTCLAARALGTVSRALAAAYPIDQTRFGW